VLGDQQPLKLFHVGKVICKDLTGDGVNDMSVLFQCCTVSSPSPFAIFKGSRTRGWKLAYNTTRILIFGVSTRGRNIILRSPRYRRTDGNCCPSSFRYYKVTYTKAHFKLRRTRRR